MIFSLYGLLRFIDHALSAMPLRRFLAMKHLFKPITSGLPREDAPCQVDPRAAAAIAGSGVYLLWSGPLAVSQAALNEQVVIQRGLFWIGLVMLAGFCIAASSAFGIPAAVIVFAVGFLLLEHVFLGEARRLCLLAWKRFRDKASAGALADGALLVARPDGTLVSHDLSGDWLWSSLGYRVRFSICDEVFSDEDSTLHAVLTSRFSALQITDQAMSSSPGDGDIHFSAIRLQPDDTGLHKVRSRVAEPLHLAPAATRSDLVRAILRKGLPMLALMSILPLVGAAGLYLLPFGIGVTFFVVLVAPFLFLCVFLVGWAFMQIAELRGQWVLVHADRVSRVGPDGRLETYSFRDFSGVRSNNGKTRLWFGEWGDVLECADPDAALANAVRGSARPA